jgi:hypothetical protein
MCPRAGDEARRKSVPHGLGLRFEEETVGVNINLLTKNPHRDPISGTPIHRHVPCRVEAL